MNESPSDWETAFAASIRRLRDEAGKRAVVGPAGPYVAFTQAGVGRLLLESDAGDARELSDDLAIAAAREALRTWDLVDADPLDCFLEGVDRDPVEDDPYNPRTVRKALRLARRKRRLVSFVFDAAAGTVELDVDFSSRAWAEVSVSAPKPVNGAQARTLRELNLNGDGARWSGRMRAGSEIEGWMLVVWSRVRDVHVIHEPRG